ncbi:hypothetical protein HELRODRAFT_160386 [Helobdella robusta]|uniref:Uncharacterized protein n=1 Tax=Helobdella robusta TaxID=6412 RepID=T1EQ68_HELRO|nr:hypothetical protein HELRODRAFT_160386 [Helobdella robusta]ESO06229.1 hypothetical protein HELRODRAFT_160386 [Helobdella robusta]
MYFSQTYGEGAAAIRQVGLNERNVRRNVFCGNNGYTPRYEIVDWILKNYNFLNNAKKNGITNILCEVDGATHIAHTTAGTHDTCGICGHCICWVVTFHIHNILYFNIGFQLFSR